MASNFKLQIYTQEKKVFDGNVESMIIPGEDGYFGVLAHHAPLVAALGKGKLNIKSGGSEQNFMVDGGFMEVHDNLATVLVDSMSEVKA